MILNFSFLKKMVFLGIVQKWLVKDACFSFRKTPHIRMHYLIGHIIGFW